MCTICDKCNCGDRCGADIGRAQNGVRIDDNDCVCNCDCCK